jgi:hypothetical protein
MADSWSTVSSSAGPPSPSASTIAIFLLSTLPYDQSKQWLSLITFTPFQRLPMELRLAIWKKTLLPRTIEVYYEYYGNTGFTSRIAVPAALQVCRESRNFALPFYPLCFGSLWHFPTTRFNLSLDILYITNSVTLPHLFGIMNKTELSSLRHIAVESRFLKNINPSLKPAFKRVLLSLSGLEEFRIVYNLPKTGQSKYCGSISCTNFGEEIPDDVFDNAGVAMQRKADNWEEWALWESDKFRPVYSWTQCSCEDGDLQSNPDSQSDTLPSVYGHYPAEYSYGSSYGSEYSMREFYFDPNNESGTLPSFMLTMGSIEPSEGSERIP